MSFVPPEKPLVAESSLEDTKRTQSSHTRPKQSRYFAAMVIVAVATVSAGAGVVEHLIASAISSLNDRADPYEGLYPDDDTYDEEVPHPGPTDDIEFTGYGDQQPLLTGEPALPRAKVPTVCAWECFGYFALMAPSPSTIELENNGLVETDEDSWSFRSLKKSHEFALAHWNALGGDPQQCFVTSPVTPINLDISGDPTPDREAIHTDAGHLDADATTHFVQSNRTFTTSLLAESYMQQLDRELRGCTKFTGPDGQKSTVSLAPALEVPESIGTVGWVISSTDSRTYVFDLQRGNIVERTVMTSKQGMGEAEFRVIVQGVASRIDTVHFDLQEP